VGINKDTNIKKWLSPPHTHLLHNNWVVTSGGARVLDQGVQIFFSGVPNNACSRPTNRFFNSKRTVFKLKGIGYILFIKSHEIFNFIIDKNLPERD